MTESAPAPLSIALSMLTMVPGGMGGSETYARALAGRIDGADGLRATAYIPSSARGITAGGREVVVDGLVEGGSTIERLRNAATIAARSRSIRGLMADADVVHYPFTVPAPTPSRRQASVQSLLDLQHLELPQMFGKAELAYRSRYYEGFARRADAVVTISHHAKSRMVDLLGIEADRIHVAHLGVDTARFTPNHGAREEFVLYPARGWPHKNHARLIEAVGLLRAERPGLRLVLTGGGLDTLGDLPDWVERRGLVSDEELRELYRTAAVLGFPSLYEGFGLPPIEAMASGCPVAVSAVGSLPEIVGDAAVTFDPMDAEAIAAGIADAMDRSAELAPRGIRRAAEFTWDACIRAHVEAYRAAREAHR